MKNKIKKVRACLFRINPDNVMEFVALFQLLQAWSGGFRLVAFIPKSYYKKVFPELSKVVNYEDLKEIYGVETHPTDGRSMYLVTAKDVKMTKETEKYISKRCTFKEKENG